MIKKIQKAADCKKEYRENMRGGDGTVEVTHFASAEELNEKGRPFGRPSMFFDYSSSATASSRMPKMTTAIHA